MKKELFYNVINFNEIDSPCHMIFQIKRQAKIIEFIEYIETELFWVLNQRYRFTPKNRTPKTWNSINPIFKKSKYKFSEIKLQNINQLYNIFVYYIRVCLQYKRDSIFKRTSIAQADNSDISIKKKYKSIVILFLYNFGLDKRFYLFDIDYDKIQQLIADSDLCYFKHCLPRQIAHYQIDYKKYDNNCEEFYKL